MRSELIRRGTVAASAVLAIGLAAHPMGKAGDDNGPASYSIGLFGDMPYNSLGRSQYPALLADINAHHVEFSVFAGALKAGVAGPCPDNLYTTAFSNSNKPGRPLVFVPGDTDGTDCGGRYAAA